MKHSIGKIWAVICTIWASTASTLTAYATEQGAENAGRAARFMLTMDVLQKVCLVIVIVIAVLILAFYIVKTVLKKLHVPPEEKHSDDPEKQ